MLRRLLVSVLLASIGNVIFPVVNQADVMCSEVSEIDKRCLLERTVATVSGERGRILAHQVGRAEVSYRWGDEAAGVASADYLEKSFPQFVLGGCAARWRVFDW